ncbi:hypothetical protein SAMN05192544_102193 [Paraburkholderia hospita]|nr:hypothetical protein SAMN05192544_102193 [Paraburkholderia hospita]
MTTSDSREDEEGQRAVRSVLLRHAQGLFLACAFFVPACRMTCAAAGQCRLT